MSTRGAVGIIYNNEEKIGYNHFDSYPSGLGNELLKFFNGKTIEYLKNIFEQISLDNTNDNWVWDWEHHTFNNKFSDEHTFLLDSLFCEFAYLINLDKNKFEVYVGFNKNPNAAGRYAKYKNNELDDYYGVKLVEEIDLNDLFNNRYKIEDELFMKIKN